MNAPQDDYSAPDPGRVQLTLFEAKQMWVSAIAKSTTRPMLWKQFEEYLSRFARIETRALTEQ